LGGTAQTFAFVRVHVFLEYIRFQVSAFYACIRIQITVKHNIFV